MSYVAISRRHILAGAVALATCAMAPAWAATPPVRGELSEQDRAALRKVEDYLNGIKSLTARFDQVDSGGNRASGKIYLSKPGNLRFEYDPPTPVLIVATGRFLIHYDRQLQSATYLNQESTPAWFLTTPKLQLSGDLRPVRVNRRDGLLHVNVVRTKKPDEGAVTISFAEDPMALREWTVTDPQGVVTRVVLRDMQLNQPVSAKLFEFDEPTWDKPK